MTSVSVVGIGNMIIVWMDLAVSGHTALVYNLKQHSCNMDRTHKNVLCICELTNVTSCY